MLLFLFVVFSIVKKFYFRNLCGNGVGQCSVLVFLRQARKVNYLSQFNMCFCLSALLICVLMVKKMTKN